MYCDSIATDDDSFTDLGLLLCGPDLISVRTISADRAPIEVPGIEKKKKNKIHNIIIGGQLTNWKK